MSIFLKNKFLVLTITITVLLFSVFTAFKFYNDQRSGLVTQTRNKVKVGLPKLASNIYVYAGIENGIFTKYGIELEYVDVNTTVDTVNALIARNIDVGGYNSLDTGLNALIGDPTAFKILATGYERSDTEDEFASSIIAKSNSPISNLKDLEGKKIAVQPGAIATAQLKYVLIKNSVDTNKVEIVQIGVAEHIQTLEAGSIDAAFAYEPYVSISQTKGYKIVKSGIFSAYYKNAPLAGIFISSKFIQEKPQVAKQVQTALAESIEYVNQNRESSLSLLPKYTKIDPEIATKVKIATFFNPTQIDAENIQKYADFSASQGIIKAKIEVANLIYKPL